MKKEWENIEEYNPTSILFDTEKISKLKGLLLDWGIEYNQIDNILYSGGYNLFTAYMHKNNYKQSEIKKNIDYLAWRCGEYNISAFANVAVVSLMVDGKEANKILKDRKYIDQPAYIINEKAEKQRYIEEQWVLSGGKTEMPMRIQLEKFSNMNNRIEKLLKQKELEKQNKLQQENNQIYLANGETI